MVEFYETLEQVRAHPKETLSPQNISKVLGMGAYEISRRARDPELRKELGFPVVLAGSKSQITRIPKEAFIRFMEGI